MLMNADHSCGIAYESVSQLRDVNKAFFLDSQIDEAAKICDVGHNAGKYHPFLYIIDSPYILVKFKNLNFLSRVTSRFLQFLKNVCQSRQSDRICYIFLR